MWTEWSAQQSFVWPPKNIPWYANVSSFTWGKCGEWHIFPSWLWNVTVPLLFRLESLWHDELKRKGKDGASLTRAFWRFCQTRMLVAIFSLLLTMVAGFVGPVSTLQSTLQIPPSPHYSADVVNNSSLLIQPVLWLRVQVFYFESVYPVSRWAGYWNENIPEDYKALDSEPHIKPLRLASMYPVMLWSRNMLFFPNCHTFSSIFPLTIPLNQTQTIVRGEGLTVQSKTAALLIVFNLHER